MTPKEKAGNLINEFKPLVYPYLGSGMLTNDHNDEVVLEIKGTGEEIWDLELEWKRRLKNYKYRPELFFRGSKTECFSKIN